jgi:hypothetical protein
MDKFVTEGTVKKRSSLAARFMAWFRLHFTTTEDTEDEARKKIIFAALSIATVFAAGINIVLVYTVPFMKLDLTLPEHQILNAMLFGWVTLCGWSVVHMYIYGLTTFLKVTVLSVFSAMILAADVCFDKQAWHVCIIVLLNGCLLLESEKDQHIMHKLSILIRMVTVVYVALRALGNACIIPSIHPFEKEPRSDGQCKTELVCIEFLNTTFPLMLNFWFVQYYAFSARREEKKVIQSAVLAAEISKCLVNYDLDYADHMLMKADAKSPMVEPLCGLLRNLRSYRSFLPHALFSKEQIFDPPNVLIKDVMSGRATAWKHATTAALRLRDPAYSLGDFHQDIVAAFPELDLYACDGSVSASFSSGISGHEELQRTMGAFYAIYCMCRLDLDGREVFTFGVNDQWTAQTQPHGKNADKMSNFFKAMDWEEMVHLMIRANLITVRLGSSPNMLPRAATSVTDETDSRSSKGTSSRATVTRGVSRRYTGEKAKFAINVERMTAMLALTAVHDIMKNKNLLPKVKKKHAPYNGVEEDAEIHDHDQALAYVMEHFPNLLPSYSGLEPGQRAPVLFSQGKMGFNNGWLVQGEAPPGALFSTFKRLVQQDGASEADISFYFVHWLTDLAGAEPFGDMPWPGSEKFVSKFPLRVLNAFLESFSFVDRLAVKTEVEVMEEYLESRWNSLGPPEKGEDLAEGHEIAAMRLALMAQGFETEVLDALLALDPSDQDVIAYEMALTGCRQQFRSAPGRLRGHNAGPAILVYYAPALVQKAGAAGAGEALSILASVFRAARDLFPLRNSSCECEKWVTVRIDKLKVLTPTDIHEKGAWHLKRVSEGEAEAELGKAPDDAYETCAPILPGPSAQEERPMRK